MRQQKRALWYRFSKGHLSVLFAKSVPLRTGTILGFLALTLIFAASLHAEVRAFPVPWRAKEGPPVITFTDLPGAGNIKIFTVAGEEVVNLTIPAGINQLPWPVVNASGRKVA